MSWPMLEQHFKTNFGTIHHSQQNTEEILQKYEQNWSLTETFEWWNIVLFYHYHVFKHRRDIDFTNFNKNRGVGLGIGV